MMNKIRYLRPWAKNSLYVLVILITLFILSTLLSLSSLSLTESLRIIFGSLYVLFLPGFLLSLIFFKKKEIDLLERIALSFALSIAIVPLVIFYLNLIGIKISLLNSFLSILGIIIIEIVILKIKN